MPGVRRGSVCLVLPPAASRRRRWAATIHPVHQPVWIDTYRHLAELETSPSVPVHEKKRLAIEQARVQSVISGTESPTS